MFRDLKIKQWFSLSNIRSDDAMMMHHLQIFTLLSHTGDLSSVVLWTANSLCVSFETGAPLKHYTCSSTLYLKMEVFS